MVNDMEVFPGTLWDAAKLPDAEPELEGWIEFCVLSSSSQGNCSVLIHRRGSDLYRLTLLDAGLSPRRTRRTLADIGLDFDRIDDVIFTHLDQDHCRPTWRRALPPHARFHIHRRHLGRAERTGLLTRRTEVFDDTPFRLRRSVVVTPTLLAHDDLGVAAFRFDFNDAQQSSLGYATDVGHVTPRLLNVLDSVDVLAIESNYCPRMQDASDRPWFLKQRITGGRGHLSNQESRAAVERIKPRRDVVLLHLSQECNSPDTALQHHTDDRWSVSAAHPVEPGPFVHVAGKLDASDASTRN